MGEFLDKHFSSLCVLLIFLSFFLLCFYIYRRTLAEEQDLRAERARLLDERSRFESRYRECLDILFDRNIAQLKLRLEFDRKAAAAFENCHSNSFSIECSPHSDFPKSFSDRSFACGLRLDMIRVKRLLEYEQRKSRSPFRLVSSCSISSSSSDDDD